MVYLACLLVGDGTPALDAIGGWAGWGSAGLLGAVLYWVLYKHLPAKDQQIERLMKRKDDYIEVLVESFKTGIKGEREAFQDEIRIEREHCAVHSEAIHVRGDKYQEEINARLHRIETSLTTLLHRLPQRRGGTSGGGTKGPDDGKGGAETGGD